MGNVLPLMQHKQVYVWLAEGTTFLTRLRTYGLGYTTWCPELFDSYSPKFNISQLALPSEPCLLARSLWPHDSDNVSSPSSSIERLRVQKILSEKLQR